MTSVLESLNHALHTAMESDPRVYILGEDILDPYGGAFKVTRGLSTRFPDRVLTTPISEAAIVGVAAGMALRGLRPVAEIMFGDFVTLIADQVVNHAAKFRWMYNEK
ncbi:MAG: alpha-ketoacid dehydrogenase subunit beta, partial [Anaerolineales bacterium]|nr:alpha-ketoacid dehydrogenase subunit beta [Anaerolineales bacterium]